MSLRLQAAVGWLMALGVAGVPLATAADHAVPDYAAIVLHEQVNRPAAEVWKRVGDYCAIADWLKVTCKYVSGTGDLGTVRLINDVTVEAMVAKTTWSYTYWQSDGAMAATSYHGSISVDPDGAGKSILTYTLFYNQAAIVAPATPASEHARLATRFQGALDAMKAIAESKP